MLPFLPVLCPADRYFKLAPFQFRSSLCFPMYSVCFVCSRCLCFALFACVSLFSICFLLSSLASPSPVYVLYALLTSLSSWYMCLRSVPAFNLVKRVCSWWLRLCFKCRFLFRVLPSYSLCVLFSLVRWDLVAFPRALSFIALLLFRMHAKYVSAVFLYPCFVAWRSFVPIGVLPVVFLPILQHFCVPVIIFIRPRCPTMLLLCAS